MANLTKTLETLLNAHDKATREVAAIQARSGELTTEGMNKERERRLAPLRTTVEKAKKHIEALLVNADAEHRELVTEHLDMPKTTPMEKVAAELEATRIMARAPLEINAIMKLVDPANETVSHPARVIIMGEAVARGVVERDTLEAVLADFSPMTDAFRKKGILVLTAVNNVLVPVVRAIEQEINGQRAELHVDYRQLMGDIFRSELPTVQGVPELS